MHYRFRKKVTVYRAGAGGYYNDEGEWVEGGREEITIKASVQPLTLREYNEVEEMADGKRITRAVKLYTDTELLPADDATGEEGDMIEHRGKRYRIFRCDAYQSGVINHYKAYAMEVANDG